jgi:RNA polymerase sigma-70 factor (ECF subfamily)
MTHLAAASIGASEADVDLAAKGDELAFARLIDAHHDELARIAFAIVGEHGLADDAVQSAWVKAWQKLPSVRDASRLRYWLISICVNESRQALRRHRRINVVELNVNEPGALAADPSVGIARLDLRRAMAQLPVDDRSLLALRYVAGLDATEIAALTGRSPSGIRARLSRLTAKLREELSQ